MRYKPKDIFNTKTSLDANFFISKKLAQHKYPKNFIRKKIREDSKYIYILDFYNYFFKLKHSKLKNLGDTFSFDIGNYKNQQNFNLKYKLKDLSFVSKNYHIKKKYILFNLKKKMNFKKFVWIT